MTQSQTSPKLRSKSPAKQDRKPKSGPPDTATEPQGESQTGEIEDTGTTGPDGRYRSNYATPAR